MSSEDTQLFLNICGDQSCPPAMKPVVHKRQRGRSLEEGRGRSSKQSRVEEGRGRSSKQSRVEEGRGRSSKQRVEQVEEDQAAAPPAGESRKDSGRGGIKTSSLFKHNPDIPDLHSPIVSQLKEEIFTNDSFSELDLHPHLVATLNKVLNVSTMTSVQKQTVPVLLSGRDAVVRSQTGSGKTLSFAVPLVQSLQSVQPRVSRADGPLAVVVVPTRELALQTFQTFQKLLKPFTWIVPGVLMGGEKRKSEKARLRRGINILVSTPGRLVDHIKHTLSIVFSSVRWLVLDEADRTLDLGFEKDLTVILNSLNSSGSTRQNVLLSATLTYGVTRLADVCLNDPVSVQVSGPAFCNADSQSESFAVPEALQQFAVVVPTKIRLVCLAAFILHKCKESHGNKLLVFVSSCEAVEFLHSLFTAVLPDGHRLGFLRLHGNMKQEERSEVFHQFSASPTGVLLCTDVAARGLHLPQVSWIIQYTPPTAVAEYVHRVGRTARAGAAGSSLLFLTPAETEFMAELSGHRISLSEMKLHNILETLMTDDTFKGRGKYHSKSSAGALQQDVRERATVLQTHFENFVHSDTTRLQAAKTALQSFLRSYSTYPAHLKHIFHIRSLHLGHAAKSFGLRDAPRGLGQNPGRRVVRNPGRKQQQQSPAKNQKSGLRKFHPGQRELRLFRSEFSSGLDDSRKRKRSQEEEES